MSSHRIAVIPGDGIGQEVIAAGARVLKALAAREPDLGLELQTFDWGSSYYRAHGRMMPDDGLDRLRGFDAIYFGAVGAPDIRDDVTLWGLRLAICQGFDQYANVRPARLLPGVASPLRDVAAGELDWIVVRENTEGEYAGSGGRVHRGLPEEVGLETAVFTRTGCRRIMRFAFGLAQSRPRRQLTLVTKSNNAELGFVALSQVVSDHEGSRWVVPDELYEPIRQDAVLLERGADSEAAKGFLEFLQGPEAAAIIGRFGYGMDASS